MENKIKLSSKDKDSIIELILQEYKYNKSEFNRIFPDIKKLLLNLKLIGERSGNKYTGRIFRLNRTEYEICKNELKIAIKEARVNKIKPEKAIKALEYCAAIMEDKMIYFNIPKSDVIKLVSYATGLSFNKIDKPKEIVFLSGAEIANQLSIIRGITIYLTNDNRLVKIEINPKELKKRKKALKFIGIGKDEIKNVSSRHDEFLMDAYINV